MSSTEKSSESLVRPIWDRNDFDTTVAATTLHDPVTLVDHGTLTGEYVGRHRAPEWMFTRSRFRRAHLLDTLAVVLLMAVVAALGCAVILLSTGTAKADTSDALAYAAEYGPAVCLTLDDYPSLGGIVGIAKAIVEQTGMTYHDAGQAIGYSVSEICPRHMGLLARFIAASTRRTPVAGVA